MRGCDFSAAFGAHLKSTPNPPHGRRTRAASWHLLGIVALLLVAASLRGFFACFNSPPFAFVGIAFDIFALASARCLLFAR